MKWKWFNIAMSKCPLHPKPHSQDFHMESGNEAITFQSTQAPDSSVKSNIAVWTPHSGSTLPYKVFHIPVYITSHSSVQGNIAVCVSPTHIQLCYLCVATYHSEGLKLQVSYERSNIRMQCYSTYYVCNNNYWTHQFVLISQKFFCTLFRPGLWYF